jgi:hypothetical protein
MVGRELISEDEARALWRRAAELQSRAEDREEYSVAPVLEDEHALSADEVLAAAEGAGIVTDYVRVALVERALPDLAWRTRGDWMGLLRFLTRYETDAIERVVLVNAAPERVLYSLEQLLSRQTYALIAERAYGDDPLRNGVYVYRVSDRVRKKFGLSSGSDFQRELNIADGRYVLLTVREADGQASQLSVRVPLLRRGENVALFTISAAALGLFGTTLASYIMPIIGMPTALSVLIPGVVGAAGVITGAAVYRRIYRWATQRGEAALERLLHAVLLESRGEQ